MPKELKEFLKQQRETLRSLAQTSYQEAMKPESWALKAEFFRRTVEILWSAFSQDHQKLMKRIEEAMPGPANIEAADLKNLCIFPGIYMLIAGYAIENLLKGVIAKKYLIPSKERPYPDMPKELPPELKSHNLVKLCEKAGLTYNSDEKEYLELLQKYVTWAGRYPIPLEWQDHMLREYPVIRLEPDQVHTMFTTLFNRWFEEVSKNPYMIEAQVKNSSLKLV